MKKKLIITLLGSSIFASQYTHYTHHDEPEDMDLDELSRTLEESKINDEIAVALTASSRPTQSSEARHKKLLFDIEDLAQSPKKSRNYAKMKVDWSNLSKPAVKQNVAFKKTIKQRKPITIEYDKEN